jgi:hypothetical protein
MMGVVLLGIITEAVSKFAITVEQTVVRILETSNDYRFAWNSGPSRIHPHAGHYDVFN